MTTATDGSTSNEPYASRIEAATDSIELANGRRLAYCEFGAPNGAPVYVFHGGVGSRGFGLLFDDTATDLGVRIISPDRPGYGRSDPDPQRTILDWADDVAALADALGLDRFGVVGVSGGGPYAAGCAAALPERISAAALVSSVGPPDAPGSTGLRVILRLARWLPWLAAVPIKRTLNRARTDPVAAIEARAKGKADAEVAMHHSDAGRQLNAQTAEGGRQGHRHAIDEMGLVGQGWGFELGAIEVPVGIWHGALDRTVPVATAEYFVRAIPSAALTVHDDVGHLSLPVTYSEEILGFLLDSASDE